MEQILTTCGFCSCGCGLYIIRNGNLMTGLCPSLSHPVSSGRLCIKGWNGIPGIRSADRLTAPLVRKQGRLEEVCWEEAISTAASRISQLVSENGERSIGVIGSAKLTNEECYALVKLARDVIGTPNLDSSSRFYDASVNRALIETIGYAASSISDLNSIRNAASIMAVGTNVMEQLPHIGSRIEDAAINGCYVVAVDPRTTRLAPHSANLIHPRPGADLVWVRALVKYVIDHQLYLPEIPETQGFEELRSSLADVEVEKAEELSGVGHGTISALAKLLAENSPLLVTFGLGVMQQADATAIIRGLANLAILLGGSILPLRGQNNAQGACDVGLTWDFLPGHAPFSYEPARRVWEAIWGRELPSEPGLSALGMLRAAESGLLKGLLVFGENLLLSSPNTAATRKALDGLEFLAVADLYLTETAQLADVVFPACSFLEKDGTFTNIERRIQPVRKVLDPIGQSRSDLDIIADLASAVGKKIPRDPMKIMAEIGMGVPFYRLGDDDRKDSTFGRQWVYDSNARKLSAVYPSHSGDHDNHQFQLIASRINYHQQTGTMASRSTILVREYAEPFAELCEADAEMIGARADESVTISSPSGSLVRKLVLNESIPRGCIHVPHYFNGDSPNALASYECDPVSEVPVYKGLSVNVEAVK